MLVVRPGRNQQGRGCDLALGGLEEDVVPFIADLLHFDELPHVGVLLGMVQHPRCQVRSRDVGKTYVVLDLVGDEQLASGLALVEDTYLHASPSAVDSCGKACTASTYRGKVVVVLHVVHLSGHVNEGKIPSVK